MIFSIYQPGRKDKESNIFQIDQFIYLEMLLQQKFKQRLEFLKFKIQQHKFHLKSHLDNNFVLYL